MTIVVCIFVCVLAITAYTLGIYQDKKVEKAILK